MSNSASIQFEESSDDGRFVRLHPILNADDKEPEKLTLTGFLDDLKDSLADQDMLALMAVERDNISAKSANVHVKGVTSFEQAAADRLLVQRQVFNDVLKWKPLSAAQTRADVVLNFADDGMSAQPSFEPIKQPKRKDYEKKLSNNSASIAKELCGDNVDTALKMAGLMPIDESDSDDIKLELETQEQNLLDAMTHQQEAHRSTAEIARLRSLLYYNEQKLKAWAKIKSKKFRRVHNRDKRLARLAKRQEEWKERHQSAVMEQAEDFLDSQYRLATSSLDTFQQQESRNTKADDAFEAHKLDVDDVPEYGEAPIDKNAKGVMRLAFMTRALQEQKDARDAINNARDSDWNSTTESDSDGAIVSETRPPASNLDINKSKVLKAHLDINEDNQPLESGLAGEVDIARRTQLATAREVKNKGKVIIKGRTISNRTATVFDNPFLKRFTSSVATSSVGSTDAHINNLPIMANESILPDVPHSGGIATSVLTADVDPDLEFAAQKYNLALQESQPVAPEKELMGWGSWFGEGMSLYDKERLTFKQEAQRAAVTAELNRRMGRRRDIKVANVSISEASNPAIVEMYAAHGIQGITDDEYATYLSTAVGPEWQSMTGYRGSIQAGRRVEKGRMILPAQLPQDYQKKMDANLEKEQKLRKQLEAQMQLIHKTKLTQQRRTLKL